MATRWPASCSFADSTWRQKEASIRCFLAFRDRAARKYYRLAPAGRKALESWMTDWRTLAAGVNGVLMGASNG